VEDERIRNRQINPKHFKSGFVFFEMLYTDSNLEILKKTIKENWWTKEEVKLVKIGNDLQVKVR